MKLVGRNRLESPDEELNVYIQKLEIFLFMCLCVYVLVSVSVCHTCEWPHRPEEGDRYSRVGLTGNKPPDVDGGNQI